MPFVRSRVVVGDDYRVSRGIAVVKRVFKKEGRCFFSLKVFRDAEDAPALRDSRASGGAEIDGIQFFLFRRCMGSECDKRALRQSRI